MPNQKLSDEWLKLIKENIVPDRVDGELTLAEFSDASDMSRSAAERFLNTEIKMGRMSRHRAKVGNRTQFVYRIIEK